MKKVLAFIEPKYVAFQDLADNMNKTADDKEHLERSIQTFVDEASALETKLNEENEALKAKKKDRVELEKQLKRCKAEISELSESVEDRTKELSAKIAGSKADAAKLEKINTEGEALMAQLDAAAETYMSTSKFFEELFP